MSRRLEFPENLYDVLGVDPAASADEIRRAGRRRQREAHPDLGGSADEFTRVRLALEVLSHPRHRAEHDAWLASARGIATPVRPDGVRLRQQQRAPRTARPPRSPAQPAARRSTAGAETPAFDRIPKPVVDARRMGWYRRAWARPADVWPGARPVAPAVSARELATALPFALVLVALVVLLAVPVTPIATPWWPIGAVVLVIAGAWIALRGRGLRAQLATTLLWLGTAIAALSAAVGFFEAMARVLAGDAEPPWVHIVRAIGALAVAALGLLAWWGLRPRNRRMRLERMLQRLADESAPPADSEEQRFGEPGGTALTRSAPGVNPVRRRFAEQLVGEALEQLARIPGARIVHGVRLPGGDPGVATISHAVLAGRRLVLVDAELRAPGEYAVDARGALTRDGAPLPQTVEFPHRVERMHEHFGDAAEVRGWLVLVADDAGGFAASNARTWARVRLGTVESAVREAGDWLADDGQRVDRLLLRDLLDLRVEP